jgi:predicted enzyme related to lactoylglutathione lyase
MTEFTLHRITIAAIHTDAMVMFYNTAFDAGLEPFEMASFTLYRGQLAGVELILVPNTLAGVTAEQNRLQFDIGVTDIDACLEAVTANGGTLLSQSGVIGEGGHRTVSITDPDGNTIVLIKGVP